MSNRTKETIRISVEVEIEYEDGFRDAAVAYAMRGLYLCGCTNQPADIIARTTGNMVEIILESVKELKHALSFVVPKCDHLHHPKKHQHKITEPCPVEELIRKAQKI